MSYCNTCNRTPCCCGLPASPTPYYVGGVACKENHTQNIYYNQFNAGLTIKSAWNIPQCGGSAILSIPELVSITIGANLWHPIYGYFEVIAFDSDSRLITVQNNCLSDNAPVGSSVPECTTFTITPPRCCEDINQNGVFVAYDFTAPDEDDCIDITLTSLEGLIAGNDAQIGSGIYFLQDVKSNNVVTICNQGQGITPGTPVIAKNVAGDYQYPVVSITVNSCTQDNVDAGVPLVCFEDHIKPLGGGGTGNALLRNSSGQGFWSNTLTSQINALQVEIDTVETDLATLDTSLDDIYGNYILPQGVPQIAFGDIPLQTFNEALSFDVDGFADVFLGGTFVQSYTNPSLTNPHAIEAIVNVGILSNVGDGIIASDPPNIYVPGSFILHEVEALWSPYVAPRSGRKFVWTTQGVNDGWDITAPNLPGDAADTIQSFININSGLYPLSYAQGNIHAEYITVAPGDTIELNVFYKATLGQNFPPASYANIMAIVSGYFKIWEV